MMETKKKKTGCLKIALIVLGILIALGIVGLLWARRRNPAAALPPAPPPAFQRPVLRPNRRRSLPAKQMPRKLCPRNISPR